MPDSVDLTLARLEDQLIWYDRRAGRCQTMYKRLKAATLVASALIPLAVLCPYGKVIAAGLGVLIVVVEGFQQLGQYQQNWFTYRGTAEALKHEKFLFFAPAGAYADAVDPHRLLAEQIESIVSQEHARWSAAQDAALKKKQDS